MQLATLAERSWLPDWLIRKGIRRLLRQRLSMVQQAPDSAATNAVEFADTLRHSDVTIDTELANEQHYEVPARFFELVLGERLKYSCGLWHDATTLDDSEEAMLRLTCERAEISNGDRILDLGCGWGSLTLWMAEKFPAAQIVALSNSVSQREFILAACAARGFDNVQVVTQDIAKFQTDETFDRIVSVEMFEHVRNYEQLLAKVASWLAPEGQLFVHIFCHRRFGYLFESNGPNDWMARNFFSGGVMPCEQLFHEFHDDLTIQQQWWLDGTHYARTCEAWLTELDRKRSAVREALAQSDDPTSARIHAQRWRIFFIACAELFAYAGGSEWGVAHYLFRPTPSPSKRLSPHDEIAST